MQDETCIWQCRYVFSSAPAKTREVLEQILANLRDQAWAQHDVFSVHLALEEALMNAIKHGNKLDQGKSITVAVKLMTNTLTVIVTDEGEGFDPSAVPDCTDDDRLEVPSGRGLCLMRSFMTAINYNDRGNQVTLQKKRSATTVALAS